MRMENLKLVTGIALDFNNSNNTTTENMLNITGSLQ